jgi:hypothetical protein
MSARVTIERILRDDDDASGQSVRRWRIEAEAEAGYVTIRTGGENSFLMIQTGDVDLFVRDLLQAVETAAELAKE